MQFLNLKTSQNQISTAKQLQKTTFHSMESELARSMHNSDAVGKALLKHGGFAADLIRFPPSGKVGLHTHPGNHMLFCMEGKGKVQYYESFHDLYPGVCYLIEGIVPHAVFADEQESLTLLVIADDHRAVESQDRLTMVNST
jgi:quercetin dioxygenase-like cupin family protein